MTKRDSNIAGSAVSKGTEGAEWLRFLQDAGKTARRPDGNLDRREPDWNQGLASLSPPAEPQAKQQAASAASAARSRGAKAGATGRQS